jgi:ubiquinone/menaquinone biosynthesis C-methylase UbiE
MKEATRKARRLGIKPFKVCRGTASALPFPSEGFDAVVSTFPSEYISQVDTLREIARVLKPGGRLVIVPGGWLASKDAKSKTFEGVARVVYGYKGSKETSGWTSKTVQNLCSSQVLLLLRYKSIPLAYAWE